MFGVGLPCINKIAILRNLVLTIQPDAERKKEL